MSTLKVNNLQVGQDATATNNFTWYQPPTPDGTVRLGIGNAGSVTPVLTASSNGKIGVGVTPTNYPDTFNVVGSSHCDKFFHNRIASSVSNSDRGLLFSIDGVQHGRIYVPNGGSLTFQAGTPGSLTDLMSFTQTGNVGIGTTDPIGNLDIGIQGNRTGGNITLGGTGSNTEKWGSLVCRQYDSDNESEGFVLIEGSSNANFNHVHVGGGLDEVNCAKLISFYTANSVSQRTGTQRLNIDNNGDVSISTGNLIFSSAGKGISFSATSDAAGMTSEILDDYEEGNFTPIVRGRTTAGTTTYPRTAVGKYVKIGRLVNVMIDVAWNSATGNGNIEFAGLPFAAHSGPYVRFAGSVSLLIAGISWTNQLSPYINDGLSHFWLTDSPKSGSYSFINITSNNSEILLNCTYMVS